MEYVTLKLVHDEKERGKIHEDSMMEYVGLQKGLLFLKIKKSEPSD